MKSNSDIDSKQRLIKMLMNLISQPYKFKKAELAQTYDVSEDTIKRDIEQIKLAGISIVFDKEFRYGLAREKEFEYLNEMLFFSIKEQGILRDMLFADKAMNDKTRDRILQKIENLHDVSRLGSHLLDKPYLTKLNLLEKAKEEGICALLVNYHSSNSNKMETKTIEPFHIDAKADILHGFDVKIGEVRHYRISRIEQVVLKPEIKASGKTYHVMATDPFRILNDRQEHVEFVVSVRGYNELIERFPATLYHLKPSGEDKDSFIFSGKVNANFMGLSNFILGHAETVRILRPDSLIDHLNEKAKGMEF